MGALFFILALAVQVAAGLAFVRRSPRRSLLETLALSHLAGSAAVGLGVTVSLVVLDRPHLGGAVVCLLLLALPGLLRGRLPAPAVGAEESRPKSNPGRFDWVLGALLALGVLTAIARVALLPLDWDGWAFWQFKARAMADGSLRRLLTAPEFGFGHPDYPLLNPSNTWWLSAGGFDPKVAQCSGLVFLADALALTYAAIWRHADRRLALIGCVVLVSWPLVMKHTASGFSDLILAAYVLAATMLLAEGTLAIALVCLVGALLTKNEGLFTFAGAIPVALAACLYSRSAPADRKREAAISLTGVLTAGIAAIGVWNVVKRRWSLNADLLDPRQWPSDPLTTIVQRLPGITLGFLREWLSIGPHYPGWGLFWPVAVFALFLSIRRRLAHTAPYWIMGGAHLAGALAAYLLTPLDPTLHLSRSLDRLLLHAGPTLVVATMITLGTLDSSDSEHSDHYLT